MGAPPFGGWCQSVAPAPATLGCSPKALAPPSKVTSKGQRWVSVLGNGEESTTISAPATTGRVVRRVAR